MLLSEIAKLLKFFLLGFDMNLSGLISLRVKEVRGLLFDVLRGLEMLTARLHGKS